jgi:hypothetical protein
MAATAATVVVVPRLLAVLRLPVVRVAFARALADAGGVSGKHKRGAAWVEADTVIAVATTADGREWPLRAGVRASVLEINARLEAEPWLLTQKAPTAGFLAVVNMQLKRVLRVCADVPTLSCSISGCLIQMV